MIDSNHAILHETLRAAGFQCDLFWDKSADELKKALNVLIVRAVNPETNLPVNAIKISDEKLKTSLVVPEGVTLVVHVNTKNRQGENKTKTYEISLDKQIIGHEIKIKEQMENR